jgi:hypothetical protein
MTGAGGGWGSIKVWREAAHMAASLTLLQITSVDLMHPQSKALPRTRGLQRRLFTWGCPLSVSNKFTRC